MFKSLIERNQLLKGTVSRGAARDTVNALGYAGYEKVNDKKNNNGVTATFVLGKNLLKKARLIHGDRVDVLHDSESNLGLIKRMPSDSFYGNRLSGKKGKNYAIVTIGGTKDIFPVLKPVINLENVTIESEGILFTWPVAPISK